MKIMFFRALLMIAPTLAVVGQETTSRIERYHLGELAETFYLSERNSAIRAVLEPRPSPVAELLLEPVQVSTAETQIMGLVKNAQKLQLVRIIGSSELVLPDKIEVKLQHVPEYLHDDLRMLTQKSKHDLEQLRHALKIAVVDNP